MLGNDPLASKPLGAASTPGEDFPAAAAVSGSATATATAGVEAQIAADVSGSATATGTSALVLDLAADVSGSATAFAAVGVVIGADAAVSGSATVQAEAFVFSDIAAVVSGSATAEGDAEIVPVIDAAAAVSGSASVNANADLAQFGPIFIPTRRPPVTLNLAARSDADGDWQTILQVPEYRIPPEPGRAEATVSQRYIVTSALASAYTGEDADLEFRVIDARDDPFGFRAQVLLPDIDVPVTLLNKLPIDGVILSGQEVLQVRAKSPDPAHVVLGIVANTRETFEVLA